MSLSLKKEYSKIFVRITTFNITDFNREAIINWFGLWGNMRPSSPGDKCLRCGDNAMRQLYAPSVLIDGKLSIMLCGKCYEHCISDNRYVVPELYNLSFTLTDSNNKNPYYICERNYANLRQIYKLIMRKNVGCYFCGLAKCGCKITINKFVADQYLNIFILLNHEFITDIAGKIMSLILRKNKIIT